MKEFGFLVICCDRPVTAILLDIDMRLLRRLACSWHEPRCSSASNFGAYGSQFLILLERRTNNRMAPTHSISTAITMKASSGRTMILFPVWVSWNSRNNILPEPLRTHLESLTFRCYSCHLSLHPTTGSSLYSLLLYHLIPTNRNPLLMNSFLYRQRPAWTINVFRSPAEIKWIANNQHESGNQLQSH